MAIDSRQKRMSAMSFGQVYIVGSNPTGTIDAPARLNVTFSYSGIAAGAVVIIDKFNSGMLAAQHVRRTMRRGRGR